MFDHSWDRETKRIENFLASYFRQSGVRKAVIGVSGGVDSAVCATLLSRVFKPGNIFYVLLPLGQTDTESIDYTGILLQQLKVRGKNIIKIDIQPAVRVINSHDQSSDSLRTGNIASRVRMIYLYDIAKKNKALVCGTENKSEYLLGYFTLHGDGASDIEPVRHLYKTQIIALARHLKVPEQIIGRKPTAGLWQGQTDEKEMGFTYSQADRVLYKYFDAQKSEQQIISEGMPSEIVNKVLKRIRENRFKRQEVISLDMKS